MSELHQSPRRARVVHKDRELVTFVRETMTQVELENAGKPVTERLNGPGKKAEVMARVNIEFNAQAWAPSVAEEMVDAFSYVSQHPDDIQAEIVRGCAAGIAYALCGGRRRRNRHGDSRGPYQSPPPRECNELQNTDTKEAEAHVVDAEAHVVDAEAHVVDAEAHVVDAESK